MASVYKSAKILSLLAVRNLGNSLVSLLKSFSKYLIQIQFDIPTTRVCKPIGRLNRPIQISTTRSPATQSVQPLLFPLQKKNSTKIPPINILPPNMLFICCYIDLFPFQVSPSTRSATQPDLTCLSEAIKQGEGVGYLRHFESSTAGYSCFFSCVELSHQEPLLPEGRELGIHMVPTALLPPVLYPEYWYLTR